VAGGLPRAEVSNAMTGREQRVIDEAVAGG
jgi:hypothetical protein